MELLGRGAAPALRIRAEDERVEQLSGHSLTAGWSPDARGLAGGLRARAAAPVPRRGGRC